MKEKIIKDLLKIWNKSGVEKMSDVSVYVRELKVEYVKWFSDIVVNDYLTSRNITIQDAVDYIGLG